MAKKSAFIHCTPKFLSDEQMLAAALKAIEVNPVNAPHGVVEPDRLAVLTSKYWGVKGVKLTVGFLDSSQADLQNRILSHMNAWGAYCNAVFVLTATDPQVRIARAADGYWSYLGVDILSIPKGQATMNLEGFNMNTPESEFRRVVRHETGHAMGFPHEHMRQQLVNRLDTNKTIAWGKSVLGWDRQTVIQQILTPLSESSIMGTPNADATSVLCYQLPGSITKDGKPIIGGIDIDVLDQEFAAKIYPLAILPPPPPPPPPPGTKWWQVKADTFDGKVQSATAPVVTPVVGAFG